MNNQKILFSIPGFERHYELNMIFLNLFFKEREKFYDDVVIDSIFDSFACCWSGGRPISTYHQAPGIFATVKNFNMKGISVRHVFNNLLIEDKHLLDQQGNTILNITENIDEQIQNGCTVNSPILAEYIKKNYPNFYIVWSTTKELNDINTINELSKNNILVLSYNFNNDFEKLKQLKHPENIEILCSEEGCVPNCPYRMEHQLLTSKMNMNELDAFHTMVPCPNVLNGTPTYYYNTVANRDWYISIDDIREKYLPLGINKFKISGRSAGEITTINTIENYVNYFAEPEYRDEIRNKLLVNYYTSKDKNLPLLF
jgi:hypothetical protein